jgi:PhoPQ-activated pathogenicity-related protein
MFKHFLLLLIPCASLAQPSIKPSKALDAYLNNGDNTYTWSLKDSGNIGKAKSFQLLLTSQQWRKITWRHQLTLIVPERVAYDGALLIVAGGSNSNEQPNWSTKDGLWPVAAQIAENNKSIVAILKQTPNQPLYDGRKEDALISYTLQQYKNDGEADWPLLFPMVKSALRAMDAVQEFSTTRLQRETKDFFVAGASKRGWTTWLSAASGDTRIKAIGPMVIDMLNMPVSLNNQLKAYGSYSEQIDDYVKLEIPQSTASKKGKAVTTMIDPYSYRKKLDVPKMIFIGTNDEYWTVDAIKFYIDKIPGETMLHYVPNAGHDLGGGISALQTLGVLYGKMLQSKPYPVLQTTTKVAEGKVQLKIIAPTSELEEMKVWSATSGTMDFRKQKWSSQSAGKGQAENTIMVELPASGYKAFYVDAQYRNTQGTYTSSTRMYLLSAKGIE